MNFRTFAFSTAAALGAVTVGTTAAATPLVFNSATATFSQNFYPVQSAINGVTVGNDDGWAIHRSFTVPGDQTLTETALFGLSAPLAAGSQDITFTLYQNYGVNHLLGDFSFGYTTDAGALVGDPQMLMTITGASSLNSATFSFSGAEVMASGDLAERDVYYIQAHINSGAAVTGFFLNVINDPANGLPTGGPGRQPSNGNFVLSEITADAVVGVEGGTHPGGVPEPATWAMMLVGFGGLGAVLRRARLAASLASA